MCGLPWMRIFGLVLGNFGMDIIYQDGPRVNDVSVISSCIYLKYNAFVLNTNGVDLFEPRVMETQRYGEQNFTHQYVLHTIRL